MNKKLIVVVSAAMLACLMLAGCGSKKQDAQTDVTQFEVVYDQSLESSVSYSIVRHIKTDVLYIEYHDYKAGSLAVMLKPDGLPLTYQEWQKQ
jgi:uncharacterized protein YcfL